MSLHKLTIKLDDYQYKIIDNTFLKKAISFSNNLDGETFKKMKDLGFFNTRKNIYTYMLDNMKNTGSYFDDIIPSVEFILDSGMLKDSKLGDVDIRRIATTYNNKLYTDNEFQKIWFMCEISVEDDYNNLSTNSNYLGINVFDFYNWIKGDGLIEHTLIKEKTNKMYDTLVDYIKNNYNLENVLFEINKYNNLISKYLDYMGIEQDKVKLDNLFTDMGYKIEELNIKTNINNSNISMLYYYDNFDKLVSDIKENAITNTGRRVKGVFVHMSHRELLELMQNVNNLSLLVKNDKIIIKDGLDKINISDEMNELINEVYTNKLLDSNGDINKTDLSFRFNDINIFTHSSTDRVTEYSPIIPKVAINNAVFGVYERGIDYEVVGESAFVFILDKFYKDNNLDPNKVKLKPSDMELWDKFTQYVGYDFENMFYKMVVNVSKTPFKNGKKYFDEIGKYVDLDGFKNAIENGSALNINLKAFDRKVEFDDLHDIQKVGVERNLIDALKGNLNKGVKFEDIKFPIKVDDISKYYSDGDHRIAKYLLVNTLMNTPYDLLKKYIDISSFADYKLTKTIYNKTTKIGNGEWNLDTFIIDTMIRFPEETKLTDPKNKNINIIIEAGLNSIEKDKFNIVDYNTRQNMMMLFRNIDNVDIKTLNKKHIKQLFNSIYKKNENILDKYVNIVDVLVGKNNHKFDIRDEAIEDLYKSEEKLETLLKNNDINIPRGIIDDKDFDPSKFTKNINRDGKEITVLDLDAIEELDIESDYKNVIDLTKPDNMPIFEVVDDIDVCNEKTVELYKTQNFKHGNTSALVKKIYDVSMDRTKFEEFVEQDKKNPRSSSKGKVTEMMLHGTGSIAVNFIAKFGFKVLEANSSGVVGRMLGHGIYFAKNLDKSLSYIHNAGFDNTSYTEGYILICDVCLGEEGKNKDYVYARANSKLVSDEWCVFKADRQVIVKQIILLESMSIRKLKEHLSKYNINI